MADFGSILRAAPIGLFMLLGTYLAARRRRSGWKRASEEYPAAAARLGLTFRAPSDAGRIGTLRGKVGGYEVFVDPDERPRLVVYFESSPGVVLRTYDHEKRTPKDMSRFDTGSALVNGLFRERFATPEAADELRARTAELEASARPLAERFRASVTHVSVTPERLECEVDFGKPRHIPVDAVEALLPAVVALARLVDEAGRAPGA